jgi:hypothetical protein
MFFTACQKETIVTVGNISGTVTDFNTGETLNNVLIALTPTSKQCYTGADGYFEFTDLEAGQYTVMVQKNGYLTDRKNVNVMAGETTTVIILMNKYE